MLLTNEMHRTSASVVVLGMFDGVHRGHQALLIEGRRLADAMGMPLVVYTFEPHPLAVLCPDRQPPRLTSLPQRAGLMAGMGVDVFRVDRFTMQVAGQSSVDFLRQLSDQLHPGAVVAGFNYTFGQKGRGNAALLTQLGPELGYHASIVPEVLLDGATVSSTRIRMLLENGLIREANRLLGRAYAITGVLHGLGLQLTMPMMERKVRPACGDYIGWLVRGDHQRQVQIHVPPEGDLRLNLADAPFPPGGRARLLFYDRVHP